MDAALLLILPVIGGYTFANNWNFTRFRSAREEGHRLYFRSVLFGTVLFAAAYLVRSLLLAFVPGYADLESALRGELALLLRPSRDVPGYDGFPVVLISFYALLLGVSAWWPLNLLFPRDWLLREAVKGDDFERLIHTAVEKDSPLCVTVDNHKVYVGFVVKTTDPARDRKTLGLLPVMSGYRRVDGGVEFTTYYYDVYAEIARGNKGRLSHLTPEDFEIVLPVDKIVSANMFDILAYEEFGRRARRKTRAPKKK